MGDDVEAAGLALAVVADDGEGFAAFVEEDVVFGDEEVPGDVHEVGIEDVSGEAERGEDEADEGEHEGEADEEDDEVLDDGGAKHGQDPAEVEGLGEILKEGGAQLEGRGDELGDQNAEHEQEEVGGEAGEEAEGVVAEDAEEERDDRQEGAGEHDETDDEADKEGPDAALEVACEVVEVEVGNLGVAVERAGGDDISAVAAEDDGADDGDERAEGLEAEVFEPVGAGEGGLEGVDVVHKKCLFERRASSPCVDNEATGRTCVSGVPLRHLREEFERRGYADHCSGFDDGSE